jgi:alkanesulfonate monooxygenase SsuD/methylene tetrahydromethanopterin reductase-like flavin-dependent oxidoreductase (luciferase family)
MVGGGGEKKTLLLAARYAGACNLFGTSPADVAHKLEVLRSHCDAEGRDYDSIEKTVLAVRPVLADVDGFLAAAGTSRPEGAVVTESTGRSAASGAGWGTRGSAIVSAVGVVVDCASHGCGCNLRESHRTDRVMRIDRLRLGAR